MIEIYSYVLFLKDSIFIIRLKSYLTEYIDITLSDLVFLSITYAKFKRKNSYYIKKTKRLKILPA